MALGHCQFGREHTAADIECGHGFAKGSEGCAGEAMLARDLSHHLHQPPRKCARAGLGGGGDRATGHPRRNVFCVKGGLVAQRPGVPGRFLLDYGADQVGPERVRAGRILRKRNVLGRRGQSCKARALAGVPIRIFVVAVAIGNIQGTQVFERDAQAGGNKVQRAVQVRQMNARQVMDERTLDFRGAHAAV